jgi:predicted Zn-dependent protease
VVDDPAVNAFALPGGYVYVTRGLLTHLESEAQLAAVLGHEIGHVTARHSINQLSRAAVASTGAGFLRIIDPHGAHVGGAAERGVADFILRHSREDEFEADDLGLRYLERARIEPHAMLEVLETIERTTAAQGGHRIPTRQSTHPDPALRRARIESRLGPAPEVAQDRAYLQLVDGMLFGENALEGFLVGPRFVHPRLGIQIDFPVGWKATHADESAMTVSADGEGLVFFTTSDWESAKEAHDQFFAESGLVPGDPWVDEIHGSKVVSNWFAINGEQNNFVGIAAFVQDASRTYGLFSLVTTTRAAELGPAIETSMLSFSPITSPAHRDLQPMRLRVVALEEDTSLAHFSGSHPSSVDVATLAVINQVEPNALLPAGTLIKTVVGFNPANLRED